jgi:triacylglycerol lipase
MAAMDLRVHAAATDGLGRTNMTRRCCFPCSLLVVALVAAQAAAGATVKMHQIDLVAGHTLTLGLDASATRNLTTAAVVTAESGRLSLAPQISVRLGARRDGIRWLHLTAHPDTPQRQYFIHGVASERLVGVVPVALRVVATPRSDARTAGSSPWSIDPRTLSADGLVRYAQPRRAFSRRLSDLARELPLVTVDLGSFGGTVPPPRGDDVYRPDVIHVVTAPNTQVTGVAPAETATVGAEIVVSGQALPVQVTLLLAGSALQILSSSPTQIRTRLPLQPVTGALVLIRTSDGAQAVLDADYAVVPAPATAVFDAFDAHATGHSWTNAYLLSLLSWLAYADDDIVRTQAAAWGLTMAPDGIVDVVTPYFVGASGSTQALVASNASSVFVAFQGSTSAHFLQDWFDNDLDLTPQPAFHWGTGVVLHHGFAEAAAIAYDAVKARIGAHLAAGRKLWITGHSLGGAVATLTAYRLRHEDDTVTQGMHVFGTPPVGNPFWASAFAAKVGNAHRWNIEHDPVPLILPPPAFVHVGVRNNLYANGNHVLADPQFFVYVPSAASLDNLLVTHMSYWCRVHEEIGEHVPGVAQTLPPPPALEMTLCGG